MRGWHGEKTTAIVSYSQYALILGAVLLLVALLVVMKYRSCFFRKALILSCAVIFSTVVVLIELADVRRAGFIGIGGLSSSLTRPIVRRTQGPMVTTMMRRTLRMTRHRWYLANANHSSSSHVRVDREDMLRLWPEEDPLGDRIENQLLFTLNETAHGANSDGGIIKDEGAYRTEDYHKAGYKVIYAVEGLKRWDVLEGHRRFSDDHCPVKKCAFLEDPEHADAVLFRATSEVPDYLKGARRGDQIWIMYILESPLNTPQFTSFDGLINWTATYKVDSEISTPYEKFVLYDSAVRRRQQEINYASRKTGPGKVAWFVSNCNPYRRKSYANELSKYISVDVYGHCGARQCGKDQESECLDVIRVHYKFYLAFENSQCEWYITEKFFRNSLMTSTIPIVMGASLAEYQQLAPYKSFIHVDQFPSVKELAEYLHYLDTNDTAYNEYFEWRGTGEFINTFFFCRLCAMLHASPQRTKTYPSLQEWWRGNGSCRSA